MANWWDDDPDADAGVAPSRSGYADAIAGIESAGSGDYRAVGPATRTGDRALGRYQVMAQNIRPWSREVLGREVTPQEFMQNPELQDQIFEGKFGQYVQKYGPEGAARAWFAGEGGMNNPNARDQLGTSVAQYAAKFNRGLGQQPQAMSFAPQEAAPQFPPLTAQASSGGNWWDSDPDADAAPQEDGRVNTVTVRPAGQTPPVAAPQTAEQPPVSMPDALSRGAARGVSGNFYEELRGLVEAGGADPRDPASLGKLLQGAFKYWTGDDQAEKTYDATLAREEALTKQTEEERPYSSLAGNVAGALALPVGAAASAATLPARMGSSALVGAGLGAAYGAGNGAGVADRASGAATGLVAGGLLGGAAPAVMSGIGAAGRGIAAAARPVTSSIRGALNPEAEAARRVVGAINRDIAQGGERLTASEMVAARNAGAPVAVSEMGGETTRALARSAANTSPEGRAALQNLADARFEGQADRATAFIRNLVGATDTQGSRDALRTQAAAVNRPAYQRAYASPNAQNLWDEGFEQLMQAPIVQEAARAATRTGANRAAAEGFTPVRNPFNFEGDRFTLAGNARPNLQFWDAVKRNLDDQIGRLQRAGENSAARDAQQLRTALIGRLDETVPEYQAARAGAARFFGAEDSLTAGENFVRSNMTAAEGARAIARMSAQERELFRQGFAARLIDDINNTRDRVNVLNKIGQSPEARAKLQVALGPQGHQRIEAFLTVEQAMDRLRTAVQGNSTTVRQMVELGLAGGATGGVGAVGAYTQDPTTLMISALMGGLTAGRYRIDQRVAQRVAQMLTSNDPAVLARGIQMASRNNNLMNALRSLDRRLARIGGQQSPDISPIQAGAVSRAEEQQPNVSGPPGQ